MPVRDTFFEQAEACTALGSPFTGKLLSMLGQKLTPDNAIGQRILNWPDDASNRGDAVALRLAGALHALVLKGKSDALTTAYPPNDTDEIRLWQAVQTAFTDHETRILHWLDSAPQTNETHRSAALMPAFLELQNRFDMPLVLSELGASAGLNLHWDLYELTLKGTVYGTKGSAVKLAPDWQGPLPANLPPLVIGKAGCDLNPLDPARDGLRLRAYLWPDQPDRLHRTQAAIAIARQQNAPIARADALEWLTSRLATRHSGAVHVVYHTVAWQYFPPEVQKACTKALQTAGTAATADAPLAHISMEADGQGEGAGLHAQIWPGGQEYTLGRADFHGRWVNWRGSIA